MGGDLGNLLTGEMGEAEARFAHEDFAAMCGRRVTQRVRRRRAVRAASMSGGTMLTAGALAVGATNVPWTTLGAAPGAGSTDCVTPSAESMGTAGSMGTAVRGFVTASADPASPDQTSLLWTEYNFDTDEGTFSVGQDADGSWWATRGDGERERLTPSEDGLLTVVTEGGEAVVVLDVVDPDVSGAPTDGFTYRVEVGSVDTADDCYTPSPTPSAVPDASASASPSPEPTPAIKPEDVIGDSPFECGFEFPTDSYGTDTLSIGAVSWMAPDEAMAALELERGADAVAGLTPPISDVASASALVMNAPSLQLTGVNIDLQTGEPSVDKIDHMVLTDSTDVGVSVGMTFVATKEGKVVATGTLPEGPHGVEAPIVGGFGAAEGTSADIYLMDAAQALSSCDASPVDLTHVELYAVAGSVVRYFDGTVDPTIYAWLPVGKP